MREAQRDLTKHHSGLSCLTELLQDAKSEIARDGYISEDIRKKIFHGPHIRTTYFAITAAVSAVVPQKHLKRLWTNKLTKNTPVSSPPLLTIRLERISELKRNVTIREDLARDAEARSFSLPPADATDKLLRYETHLDRQLYRAMDQLERLQRQRRGENVPPPLNINLGRRR